LAKKGKRCGRKRRERERERERERRREGEGRKEKKKEFVAKWSAIRQALKTREIEMY